STTRGNFSFTLLAALPYHTATKAFMLAVGLPPLAITTATPLPFATSGQPYSQTLTASGGEAPYTWSIVGGTKPDGLVLSPDGVLSGTPPTPSGSNFTVQVTDSAAGTPQTVTKAFSMVADPPPPLQIGVLGFWPPAKIGQPYSTAAAPAAIGCSRRI